MMSHDSNRPRRVWVTAAFVLTAIGMACSGYLLWRHIAGSTVEFRGCTTIFGYDCDAATRSPWSVILGIPLGGWGLVHFGIVFALLLLAVVIGDGFRTEGFLAALLASIAATGAGAALTFVMLAGDAPVCPWCLAVHAVNLLLIPAVLLASGHTPGAQVVALGQGLRYVFSREASDPMLARWKVTGLFTAAFAGIIVYQWVQIQVDRAAVAGRARPSLAEVVAEFDSSPVNEIPSDDAAPRWGPAEATVSLTVFCDFECPACRAFAKSLRSLRLDHPVVLVVFRHFPLSSGCNPAAQSNLHPHACQAALAAEAARRQGRFREFHEAAFATSAKLDDMTLLTLARGIGLDLDRFDTERQDAESNARVSSDVRLGIRLKIDGTPTVFVNGRLVGMKAMSRLGEIVDRELGRANAAKDALP